MAQKHLCVSTLIWLCITSCESFLPLTNRTWLQNRYGYEKESRRNSEMTDRTNGLTASPHEDCQCIVHNITASLSMRQHHRTKMSFAYSTEEIGKQSICQDSKCRQCIERMDTHAHSDHLEHIELDGHYTNFNFTFESMHRTYFVTSLSLTL